MTRDEMIDEAVRRTMPIWDSTIIRLAAGVGAGMVPFRASMDWRAWVIRMVRAEFLRLSHDPR